MGLRREKKPSTWQDLTFLSRGVRSTAVLHPLPGLGRLDPIDGIGLRKS